MRKGLLFVDRDGVINHDSEAFIKSDREMILYEPAIEGLAKLYQNHWRIIVVSNQSGLARNLFSPPDLHRMHWKIQNALNKLGAHIESFCYCPHGPDDECSCRKPQSGLLLELQDRLGIRLAHYPMVGDSLRDLQAAREAGLTPLLLGTGNGKGTLESLRKASWKVPYFEDFGTLVDFLLA
jgi:D-glycero-D-manno-heptose 1,7-bisphosphate phosphatase